MVSDFLKFVRDSSSSDYCTPVASEALSKLLLRGRQSRVLSHERRTSLATTDSRENVCCWYIVRRICLARLYQVERHSLLFPARLPESTLAACVGVLFLRSSVAKAGSMEAKEASSSDDNKRVEEARRARVLWLEKLRRECSSEEEFETARSQPTWTELDSTSCSSSCAPDGPSPADLERVRHENRLHFQHLLDTQPPGPSHTPDSYSFQEDLFGLEFFVDCGGKLEVGQKIGGGGQAEIYRAIYEGKVLERYVLKVFRNEYYLADLQRLWMKNIASTSMYFRDLDYDYCCITNHGTLLQDGRFAFIMRLCWGDLRKAIDGAILKDKTYRSPPIPYHTTWVLIFNIARGMEALHARGILHKDLKGANCLLLNEIKDRRSIGVSGGCMVADFDSPEGVIGTGFWRAPEILLALKNKVSNPSSHPGLWTEKVDVYSYAMTCYEILTGFIPFEGREIYDYDGVICGERPPLPDYVDLELRELVEMCWHSEPLMRPTFEEIREKLLRI